MIYLIILAAVVLGVLVFLCLNKSRCQHKEWEQCGFITTSGYSTETCRECGIMRDVRF